MSSAPHDAARALAGSPGRRRPPGRRRGHRVRPPRRPADRPPGAVAGQVSFGRTPAGDTTPAGHVRGPPRPGRRARASRGSATTCGRWSPRPACGRSARRARPPPATAPCAARRSRPRSGRSPARPTTGRRRPTPPGPAPAFTDPVLHAAHPVGPARRPDLGGRPHHARPAAADRHPRQRHRPHPRGVGRPRQPPGGAAQHAPRRHDASDHGDTGHGTHVAGIAAAPRQRRGRGGRGAGASPAAQVIPVQIADTLGASTDETMMKGIRHAVPTARRSSTSRPAARASPAPSRTPSSSPPARARDRRVGRQPGPGRQRPQLPGGLQPRARRRRAVRRQRHVRLPGGRSRPPTFSNHNRTVDVIAPGVNILSSVPARVTDRAVAPGTR